MKTFYEQPKLEVLIYQIEDVITESVDRDLGENDLPPRWF